MAFNFYEFPFPINSTDFSLNRLWRKTLKFFSLFWHFGDRKAFKSLKLSHSQSQTIYKQFSVFYIFSLFSIKLKTYLF